MSAAVILHQYLDLNAEFNENSLGVLAQNLVSHMVGWGGVAGSKLHSARRRRYRPAPQLTLIATMLESDSLSSPLLPGFSCPVRDLFEGIPLVDSE